MSTAAAVQLEMDFLLAHAYPLLFCEEAGFLLDVSDTSVENQIDSGIIPALNISRDIDTRRTLRVWRWAVVHRCIAPERPLRTPGAEVALPHSRPLFLMREIADLLRCTSQHVYNLYEDGHLQGPDRNAGRAVHGRSPRIFRDSVVQFLTSRAIGAEFPHN